MYININKIDANNGNFYVVMLEKRTKGVFFLHFFLAYMKKK